jgi:hypothetical protein
MDFANIERRIRAACVEATKAGIQICNMFYTYNKGQSRSLGLIREKGGGCCPVSALLAYERVPSTGSECEDAEKLLGFLPSAVAYGDRGPIWSFVRGFDSGIINGYWEMAQIGARLRSEHLQEGIQPPRETP